MPNDSSERHAKKVSSTLPNIASQKMSAIDRRCDLLVRFIGYRRKYTGRILTYPGNSGVPDRF